MTVVLGDWTRIRGTRGQVQTACPIVTLQAVLWWGGRKWTDLAASAGAFKILGLVSADSPRSYSYPSAITGSGQQ